MLGFSVFIIVIVTLVFLIRLKRQREIDSFKDANFADFVDFDAEKDGSGGSSAEMTEIAASVTGALIVASCWFRTATLQYALKSSVRNCNPHNQVVLEYSCP